MANIISKDDTSQISTHEDLTVWKEGQEIQRGEKRERHDLRIKMCWDWTIYSIATLLLIVSLTGAIGWIKWPEGDISPIHILLSIISTGVGTQIKPIRESIKKFTQH